MLRCSPTRPVSQGIVRAIRDYQVPLKEHEVTIFVRRGGPNYQEGLRVMGEVGMWSKHFLFVFVNQRLISVILSVCFSPTGKTTGIPIHVFGTETHMTAIVGMALGHRPIPNQPPVAAHTANFLLNSSGSTSVSCGVVRLCPRELPRHGLCVCSPQCSGLSDAQWLLCAFTPAFAGTRPVTHCDRPEASIKTASAQLSVE